MSFTKRLAAVMAFGGIVCFGYGLVLFYLLVNSNYPVLTSGLGSIILVVIAICCFLPFRHWLKDALKEEL